MVLVDVLVGNGLDLVEGQILFLVHGVELEHGAVETHLLKGRVGHTEGGITSDGAGQLELVDSRANVITGLGDLVQTIACRGRIGNHNRRRSTRDDVLGHGHITDDGAGKTRGRDGQVVGRGVGVDNKAKECPLNQRKLSEEVRNILETNDGQDEPPLAIDIRPRSLAEVVETDGSCLGCGDERSDRGCRGVERRGVGLTPEQTLVGRTVLQGLVRVQTGGELGQVQVIDGTVACWGGKGLASITGRVGGIRVESKECAVFLQGVLGETGEEFEIHIEIRVWS